MAIRRQGTRKRELWYRAQATAQTARHRMELDRTTLHDELARCYELGYRDAVAEFRRRCLMQGEGPAARDFLRRIA